MTPGAGSSVRGDYSATKGPCHQTGASLCRAGRPTSSEPTGPVELPGHDPRGGGCAKFLPIVSARREWLYTFLYALCRVGLGVLHKLWLLLGGGC